jgi:serine/threonine protein kinase
VRNVLMKSDGSSERGCIAKVADFGLAVKMDHQDTHVSAFQVCLRPHTSFSWKQFTQQSCTRLVNTSSCRSQLKQCRRPGMCRPTLFPTPSTHAGLGLAISTYPVFKLQQHVQCSCTEPKTNAGLSHQHSPACLPSLLPPPFPPTILSTQGTMSHMAPEALLRGHISKKADVYSYGITLWELFTGCHAYHGESPHTCPCTVLCCVVCVHPPAHVRVAVIPCSCPG